jgi:hypothetical protein
MMSRGYVYLLLIEQAGQVGGSVEHLEGKGGRVLWLFRGFYVVALIRVG